MPKLPEIFVTQKMSNNAVKSHNLIVFTIPINVQHNEDMYKSFMMSQSRVQNWGKFKLVKEDPKTL